MKNNLKKGFTLVELVIVIAVIAILSAVLIPTFSNLVQKANVSADTQLVKNLNTALSLDNKKHNTMYEALQAAKNNGYDVAKINATATNNEILWDSNSDVFCYLNGDAVEYIPDSADTKLQANDYRLWKISNEVDENYSVYLYNYSGSGTIDTTKGFDCGEHTNITVVNYTGGATAQEVIIRTKGDTCILNIENASLDEINFYGFASEINVKEVASSSLHIYGSVSTLSVEVGHVQIENTGIIFNVAKLESTASITNKGYISSTSTDAIKSAIESQQGSKLVGGSFEIDSLAKLEAFRDTVNSGKTFFNMIVELKSDITLNDGWNPIGEGSRKVAAVKDSAQTGTAFRGEFNGNGHTISNLNNKGWTPSQNRIAASTSNPNYAYGLFALTASGAYIHDLKLTNVNIDTSRYSAEIGGKKVKGDSVGALIGFSGGELVIENVDIIGTNNVIKANDALGGLIGRCYKTDKIDPHTSTNKDEHKYVEIKISNCDCNIKVIPLEGCQNASGILGYLSSFDECVAHLIIINNNFSGSIEGTVSSDKANIAVIAFDSVYGWDKNIKNVNDCLAKEENVFEGNYVGTNAASFKHSEGSVPQLNCLD